MIYDIKFTPEAEETYLAIKLQLKARWGEKVVDNFENKVSNVFDLISSDPEIYPQDKVFTALRKCVLHKNCSMFYKRNVDHILITYFWDNRQDPITLT
ncbi:MAG: type II toxin-antitoxin system RelE/ParE family toxin [Bacteroidota bacterium]